MQNTELFNLYDAELVGRNRSARGLHEARRTLGHFQAFLGDFPPTPELAKQFLAQFSGLKITTIARYTAIIKTFMAWYGEPLDIRVSVPKTLPSYVEKSDIDKLLKAIRTKQSHKGIIERDTLIVEVAINTGLRRSELANLRVGDIDKKRQLLVVRKGKGGKDRVIPLSQTLIDKFNKLIEGKTKNDSVFNLSAAGISDKIKIHAKKAGVDIHTHSLRDYFATTLMEKGATIREIQSLLGHANLTHTERYTLHTDKHLKKAIELLDKDDQTREKGVSDIDIPSAETVQKPMIIIKAIDKPPDFDPEKELGNTYFSHFLIKNDGNSPAIELKIIFYDESGNLISENKEPLLGIGEKIKFKPVFPTGKNIFKLICQYKNIHEGKNNNYFESILPFNISQASK